MRTGRVKERDDGAAAVPPLRTRAEPHRAERDSPGRARSRRRCRRETVPVQSGHRLVGSGRGRACSWDQVTPPARARQGAPARRFGAELLAQQPPKAVVNAPNPHDKAGLLDELLDARIEQAVVVRHTQDRTHCGISSAPCGRGARRQARYVPTIQISETRRNSGETVTIHAASRINQLRKLSSAASQSPVFRTGSEEVERLNVGGRKTSAVERGVRYQRLDQAPPGRRVHPEPWNRSCLARARPNLTRRTCLGPQPDGVPRTPVHPDGAAARIGRSDRASFFVRW